MLNVMPCAAGDIQQSVPPRAEVLVDNSRDVLSFSLVVFERVDLVIVTRSLRKHGISSNGWCTCKIMHPESVPVKQKTQRLEECRH
jgi:hypothetical protein